jgi:hypothetical protein
LRFPGVCATCGITLSPGTEAFWNRKTKQATCLACAPSSTAVTAVAEQLTASETAPTWGRTSAGESRLTAFVDRELGDRVIALHDRSMPGTKASIDHIFLAPTGVWVVDAKAYKGKVVKRDVGPVWREENEVYVGGRNRTSLAKGVERQVDCVLAALRLDPGAKGAHA